MKGGWVGMRTHARQTFLKWPKFWLVFPFPLRVCTAIVEKGWLIAHGCFWLPAVARGGSFDCLNRLSRPPSCFLFIQPLLSWPSPTPQTVNMLTQFQNKGVEWDEYKISSLFTQRWCVVYALPNANIGKDQVAKIWATYCRCFCSHRATSVAMFYLLRCTHLIVCFGSTQLLSWLCSGKVSSSRVAIEPILGLAQRQMSGYAWIGIPYKYINVYKWNTNTNTNIRTQKITKLRLTQQQMIGSTSVWIGTALSSLHIPFAPAFNFKH